MKLLHILCLLCPFGVMEAVERKLDVSSYPAALQKANEVFENKCSACHSLRKSIGTNTVLPSDWERSLQRMQAMPDSGLTARDIQQVYELLVYDTVKRRGGYLQAQMKVLSAEQKAQEQAKITAVMDKFSK